MILGNLLDWVLTGGEYKNRSQMNTFVVAEHWKDQSEIYESKYNRLTNSIKSIPEIVYDEEEDA